MLFRSDLTIRHTHISDMVAFKRSFMTQAFNILIIDDEDDVRERLKNILERRGYFVLTAKDGLEGLEIMEKNNISVIFCDIVMPRMDGIEFLEKIKKSNFKAEVIMITGCSTVELCIESLQQNALHYLIKPVSIENILDSLNKAEQRIKAKKMMLKTAVVKHMKERKTFPHYRLISKLPQ